jgi:lysophospholipase L1-like esterase
MKKRVLHIALWLLFFSISSKIVLAQYEQYPFELSYYNIVKYDSNHLKFPEGKANFEIFYNKLSKVISTGKSQINIVQYGGSHIQADIFSGECRTRFQSFDGGINAGRGFVFPYRLAHTNTPYGYYFRYTGSWTTCRNVQKRETCDLGMAGISARTEDTLSSLTLLIEPDNDLDYSFNRIKIYHEIDSMSFSIRIDSNLVDSQKVFVNEGYTEFYLNKYTDSLYIEFYKSDSIQTYFQLYGMNLETEDAGIVYHNLGINGAATTSFLRCNRMELDLKSIKPDLVIFGIGINDAYGRNFSQSNFERNYDSLVSRVLAANPDAAIIFVSNNDSYIHKRYLNRNGIKVQESMYRLAKRHNAAVWDMFEIMGGLNSIVVWQKDYLAKRDRVHFTRTGYILLGDLLFDAIIRDYGSYLEQQADLLSNVRKDFKSDNNALIDLRTDN